MFYLEDKYLAHTSPNKKPETLKEHSSLTKEYLEKIKTAKNLHGIIKNIANSLLNHDKLLEFFDNFIIWHDIGKKNPAFQNKKMNNKLFSDGEGSSTHSNYSVYELKECYEKFLNELNDEIHFKFVYIFYYLLSNVWNHHGKLKHNTYKEDIEKSSKENELDGTFFNFLNGTFTIPFYTKDDDLKNNEIGFQIFIFIKLHFSILIASDFYATSQYMNDIKTDDFGIFDEEMKEKFYGKFIKYYKEHCNLKNKSDYINQLRKEIFEISQKTLNDNLDKNIFYLEAPTGSGKTLNSLNLALRLLKSDKKLNKIFYVFPFNTLISQNKAIFKDIFNIDIPVVNSITPIYYKNNKNTQEKSNDEYTNSQEDLESNYEKTYSDRTFFNYPFVLTSHVSLFNILFGINKEDNYPLFSLANSVIILDEIQSYRSDLWEFMGYFFESFSAALNIKFIIMSATLPNLSKLTGFSKKTKYCELLPNSKKYFQNKLFKDRVKLDFSILNEQFLKSKDDKKNTLFQKLTQITKNSNKNKVLFEFITRKTAREFYEFIKDKFADYQIFELSGDDNKLYRQYVIDKTKKDNKIILVSTQVIEAGVDIDMDLGFKDISYLESEEQFLGRINRSFTKGGNGGIAYFFDYDNANNVYGKDDRLKFNIKTKNKDKRGKHWRECLISKDFEPYYKELFVELRSSREKIARCTTENIRESFLSSIKELNFESIFKKMELIENNQKRIFIPFKIDIRKFDKEFIDNEYGNIEEFLDGSYLCGEKVWEAIKALNEVRNYSQRKITALNLNALADIFSFNIYLKEEYYSELECGYYYIEDFTSLIDENCKFNRKEFENKYISQELII